MNAIKQPTEQTTSQKRKKTLTNGLVVGGFAGFDNIVCVISFSSLIFQGVLAPFVGLGANILLICALITGVIGILFASRPYSVFQLQDEAAILVSSLVGILVHSFSQDMSGVEMFATTLFWIGIITITTGLLFFLVGSLQLGHIVRYLPYPVIAGFLAATGWLVFYGTFNLLLTNPKHVFHWYDLLNIQLLIYWLPSLFFGTLLYIIKNKYKSNELFILILVVVGMIFYGVLWLLEINHAQAIQSGLMLEGVSGSATNLFYLYNHLGDVRLDFSLSLLSNGSLVIFVSFVALLFNASSLELYSGEDVNVNTELKAAGVANLLNGCLGGTVGYLTLSHSLLASKLGEERGKRITGIVALMPLAVVLFFGFEKINLIPKVVICTYLFYVAFLFIHQWLVRPAQTLNHREFAIVAVILVVSILFNMIVALFTGLIIATILFAVRYSSLSPIKFHFSRREYKSTYERDPTLQKFLLTHGDLIHYIKLQGFLFFGSIYKLLDLLKKTKEYCYIILDFELVSDVDSSTILLWLKLNQLINDLNVKIVFAALNPFLTKDIKNHSMVSFKKNSMYFFPEKEVALQWCEEQLIANAHLAIESENNSFQERLQLLGFSKNLIDYFALQVSPRTYPPQSVICEVGAVADSVYFLFQGKVSVMLGTNRIYTVGAGNIIGEMAMYTDATRSATLIADIESIIYEIKFSHLDKMAQTHPEYAIEFHHAVASIIANKLLVLNKQFLLFNKALNQEAD